MSCRWFGLTKQGTLLDLGIHDSIDEADSIENGGAHCIWIWRENDLRELHQQITELLTQENQHGE